MLRKTFFCITFIVMLGCGDTELGLLRPDVFDENAPAAPAWTPDAILIDELIYPYAAKQAVGQHDVRGETFRLASCEVLYKSRRVLRSQENHRWVRLSTGQIPAHATGWTHNDVPQFLYIFLNFNTEADYQRFGIGTHANVPVTFVGTQNIGANTWELTLRYSGASSPAADTPVDRTPTVRTPATVAGNSVQFEATAATGYFWSGVSRVESFTTLTGIAYDATGLTLRSATGFPTRPGRIVLTQRSAPTRTRSFGRRITFEPATVHYSGNYATIDHVNLSAEQSKDLRLIGEDIQVGDIFHLYVYE